MAKSKSTKGKKPKKAAPKPKKSVAKPKKAAPAPKKSTAKPKTSAARSKKSASPQTDIFKLRSDFKITKEEEDRIHVLRPGIICNTEPRGNANPEGKSDLEIVVDASEGFIPLWANNTTLHWRFQERSLLQFQKPDAVKEYIRNLLGQALIEWGSAAPVKFSEDQDLWDFEIVAMRTDDCTPSGCVLASAFFPDSGRHELAVYPKMFEQDQTEQIDTLVHEIGHVFGLRHFFANVSETEFRSEIFGTHSKFSIMNYGELSKLTNADKDDLARLYKEVWGGSLTQINRTPIRLVKPFHTLVAPPMDGVFAMQPAAAKQ